MKRAAEVLHKKAELRKIFLKHRNSISAAEKQSLDELIFQQIINFPPLIKAKVIMTYLALKSEVDTFRLVKYCLNNNKCIVIPRTDSQSGDLIPGEIKNLDEDLCRGSFKILEPRPDRFRPAPLEKIDLCIVPGIVFDLKGHRIGHSHGYYDKFLKTLPPRTITIGLAYECQLLSSLPTNEWDMSVNYVITENRIIRCK